MPDNAVPVRLKGFVGRSFDPDDELVWFEIRKILESLRSAGFIFEDAREAQPRPVSAKVQEGITRNNIYIGILTRRMPISRVGPQANVLQRIAAALRNPINSCRWTPSAWVVQESGFALGQGKTVILLIERGVDFPTADLDADTEWIPFDRAAVAQCLVPLVQMINNLIAKMSPTSAPALPASPPAQEPGSPEPPREMPALHEFFPQVMSLVNEGRFADADDLFDGFSRDHPEALPAWFRYFYLAHKYLKGDTTGLQKLREIVAAEPGNADAIEELARCYRGFKAYDQAARVLLEAKERVAPEARARLLLRAAEDLARDGQSDRALAMVADVCQCHPDPGVRIRCFLSLAEVAEQKGDKDLQAASLEQALDLDPGDGKLRFRLAFLYSETNRDRLAAYHYTLRARQARDATALNNLGVAFGRLKLQGKEIEAFESASTGSTLAKANISLAYIDRGFLRGGQELATEVERSSDDKDARETASRALTRIGRVRKEEDEQEEAILAKAKAEREFRSRYAVAFVAAASQPLEGIFETPYGRLSFSQDQNTITGEGSFEEEIPVGFGLLTALTGTGTTGAQKRTRVRRVKFQGDVYGLAGRFKLEVTEQEAGLLTVPRSSSAEGLFVVSPGGDRLELLEEKENEAKIYAITRVG